MGDIWIELFKTQYALVGEIVGATLLAALGIVVLVWIIANILDNNKVKAYSKSEVYEILYSGVLFILIFSLFPTANTLVEGIVPQLYNHNTISKVNLLTADETTGYSLIPKHFRYAKYFLSSLSNEGIEFGWQLTKWYTITSPLETMYVSLDVMHEQRGSITYYPLGGLFKIGNVIKMQIFDMVTKLVILSKFQEITLSVFMSGFFSIFLSAGIILRSFPITRKLGGLLMAVSISIYFIFPLSYLFAGAIYESSGGNMDFKTTYDKMSATVFNFYNSNKYYDAITENQYITKDKQGNDVDLSDSGRIIKDFEGNGSISKIDVCAAVINDKPKTEEEDGEVDKTILSTSEWWSNLKKNGIDVWAVDDSYFDKIGRLIFYSLTFSFVGLMMTIATIRSLSGVFGGDLEIAGLTYIL